MAKKYHIGVIKYYDSYKNFKGLIQSAIFADGEKKDTFASFSQDSIHAGYKPDSGDIVFFFKGHNETEVYSVKDALLESISIPWDEILHFVGNDAFINIENVDNRTGGVSFRKSIRILTEDWLQDLSYNSIKSLLSEVCERIDEVGEDYISAIMDSDIRTLFLKECLSPQYFSILNDDEKVDFVELLKYIYKYSLSTYDFKSLSLIISKCDGLEGDYYKDLVRCCNELFVNSPQELMTHIRDLDCFHAVVANLRGRINFRLEVYLARAIVEKDFAFVPNLISLDEEQLRTWLQTLNDDDFGALSLFFAQADDTFKQVYFDLSLGDDDILLPLYKYFSDEQKSFFLKQLANEDHYASDFFNKHVGLSLFSVLTSDTFFASHPEYKVPSERIKEGYAKQFSDLYEAGIIDEISDSNIKTCIAKVSTDNDKLSVFSTLKLGQDRIKDFLIKEMPDSKLAKSYRRKLLEDRISSFNYAVFDLEARSEKDEGHYVVEQAAFVSEKETVVYPSKEVRTIEDFYKRLSEYKLIVGHNIKKWDIGKVFNWMGLFFNQGQYIWDTLEVEMVLNPFSKGYSLNNPDAERHTALSDSLFTQSLFWSQILSLAGKEYDWFKVLLPVEIRPIFEIINSGEASGLFENRIKHKSFFKQYGRISRALSLDLSGINNFNAPIVIAPKSLWRIIRENSDVFFYGDDKTYSRFDRDKLSNVPVTDIKTAILHSLSSSARKDILVCDLSPAVKGELLDLMDAYLTTCTENSPLCCTSWQFDSLEQKRKDLADAIFIVGKEIEARENSNERIRCENISLSSLTSREGLRLLRKFAESNASNRISRDIYQVLTGTHPPRDYGNMWIEAQPGDRFRIKYNRDFFKYESGLEETYQEKIHVITIQYNSLVQDQEPIHIIRTSRAPKKSDISFENPESIQRLSSTTKSRCSYWTYQLSLIASMKKTMPVVWVVEKSGEIDALKSAARELGFYVPLSEQIQRSIELANEIEHPEQSLIIIGGKDFRKLIDADIQEKYCLVYNCIDFESKLIRWNGMLPFGDEPVKASDVLSPDDYIYASWPQFEIINYLIHEGNPDCKLCMLDPIFDCSDLNYRKLKAKTVSVTPNNAYSECKEHIEKYFLDPPAQAIKVDETNAMEEMLEMFKEINPNVSDWKDAQRAILPDIIKKEQNCLICMPTGGGKSILFQLPALYRAKRSGKMSIVISPLKALLKDQVVDLDMPGVEYLNSDKTADEIERIYQKIRGGEIQLLYMTPERFRSQSFMNALGYRLRRDNGLEYIIFDEAHCISQWGLDFRPDYRYAAIVSQQISDTFKDVKIELFTATVTKNVREDISSIITVPNKQTNNQERYNPIRDHINIQFVSVNDDPNAKGDKTDPLSPRERKRVELLYNEIVNSDFDPERSTMLIFSSTHRQVELFKEELARLFSESQEERIQDLAERIECFHGGMTTEERDDIYRKFKGKDKKSGEGDEREYSILIATKAFGMGMNIPDIHYIYHAFPSDNIEDYLQEIGRAGRDDTLFPKGYGSRSKKNCIPLPTKCFVSDEDVRRSRELQSKSSLKWDEVRAIYDVVSNYISAFTEDGLTYVSVPSNVWKRKTDNGIKDDPTAFKIGLHWLSLAGRIETRYLSTAAYDFIISENFNSDIPEELKPIHDYIQNLYQETIPAGTKIQIKISDLRSACGIRQSELDNLVLQCQNQSVLMLANEIAFNFSNRYKKNALMNGILNGEEPEEVSVPFKACLAMFNRLNNDDSLTYDTRIKCIREALIGTQFSVRNAQRRTEKRRKAALDNEISRIGLIAFKLFKLLPSVKSLKEGSKTKKWQFDIKLNSAPADELESLHRDSFDFLSYLTRLSYYANNRNDEEQDAIQRIGLPSFVWTEAAIALGFESYLRIYNSAEAIKGLGLASIDSFLPTGTEVKLTELREPLIPTTLDKEAIKSHRDAFVYTEFNYIENIRQLKLVNLMTLAKIKADDSDSLWLRYDEAIKDYFDCSRMEDFLNWTNNIIDKDWLTESDKKVVGEQIQQYQGAALNEEINKLNPEQTKVCNYDKEKDLVVLAGPGSGKTRVLTLRCAKLLHTDKVSRDDLLVLAYNRGVVNELKTRLRKLFLDLGYTRMMSRIKVMTFHSFVKTMDSMIKERRAAVERIDVAEARGIISGVTQDWEKDFCSYLSEERNVREFASMLDATSFRALYFMIDEFQDVTRERLDVLLALRRILPTIPNRMEPRFFVIGDINQSIYGYQRIVKDKYGNNKWVEDDGTLISISPQPYYEELRTQLGIRKEDDLTMGINYRSYQKILDKAEAVLHTCSRYDDVHIVSDPKMEQREDCVFEFDAALSSWDGDFLNIIDDLKKRGIKQAAFLFRTNSELYDAYTKLRKILNSNASLEKQLRISIRGNSEQFFRTRECYYAIYYLKEQDSEEVVKQSGFNRFLEFIAKEKQLKGQNGQEYLDKEAIDLTYAIALSCYDSMPQNPTYGELAEEMIDVAYEKASDLLKIKENYKDRIPNYEERSEDEIELVFSVMHRVKGLEFDAVIVNPSENQIGYERTWVFDESSNRRVPTDVIVPDHALQDLLDEERRLLYVSYTRAKKYLRIYNGPREKQLFEKQEAYWPIGKDENSSVRIEPGLNSYNMSYGLKHNIPEAVSKNTEVRIKKNRFGHGEVWYGNSQIGELREQSIPAEEWEEITGLYLNDVYVWRYEDVCNNDIKYDRNNAEKWPVNKRRPHDFVLIPDVAGIGNI